MRIFHLLLVTNELRTGYVLITHFTDAIEHNDEHYDLQYSEMSGSSN